MEKYKQVLKIRIVLLTILVLLVLGLGIYDVFFANEATRESFIFSFQCGTSIAVGLISAVLIIRFKQALKDDAKLKVQYNKENDERLKAIRAKAGIPILLFTSVGMIVAGIIAGYFNSTIFITLIIAASFQMLIGVIIKQIYLRKI